MVLADIEEKDSIIFGLNYEIELYSDPAQCSAAPSPAPNFLKSPASGRQLRPLSPHVPHGVLSREVDTTKWGQQDLFMDV